MGSYTFDNPQAVFEAQYQTVRRDEVVGVLLALFLGCFGIHHFYVGRNGLGIFYICIFWTGIPALLGVIECFFMPARVREYNAFQAAIIAANLGIPVPAHAVYAGWPAPGFAPYAYAQPVYASTGQQTAVETTLLACSNCKQTNPPGARFCTSCGTQLG